MDKMTKQFTPRGFALLGAVIFMCFSSVPEASANNKNLMEGTLSFVDAYGRSATIADAKGRTYHVHKTDMADDLHIGDKATFYSVKVNHRGHVRDAKNMRITKHVELW
ncbi:MAG: hypothetical protein HON43_01725 [Alphaproteobacteria bacterium]|jgi:hypothetical protein|nr:hypothetical protein [Alphaproteobacteria bacterium]MBT5390630.1 hypothetical protein [Alphaproteobacteria bacterium]MBT5540776.1 hypothetical protein [Alphaproteobacteria bacterium]